MSEVNNVNSVDLRPSQTLINGGEGTYGQVYLCNDPGYVCKVFKKTDEDAEGLSLNYLRELGILTQLNGCENIVEISGYRPQLHNMQICMTKHDRTLRQRMKASQLTDAEIQQISYQLLVGLYQAQSLGVVHRDLKPENVLIDHDGRLAICDWGLSCFMENPEPMAYSGLVQTRWYRAPEVLLGGQYNQVIDMWSLGLIMVEMYNGRALLPGDCDIDQLFRIFELFGTPDPSTWEEVETLRYYSPHFPKWKRDDLTKVVPRLNHVACNLLTQMFQLNPSSRLGLVEALNHPYFLTCRRGMTYNYLSPLVCYQMVSPILPDFLSIQTAVGPEKRRTIMCWLQRLKPRLQLSSRCLFLAIYYVDLMLSSLLVTNDESLLLLSLSCLWVASKVMGSSRICMEDLIKALPNHTPDDYKNMEQVIVKTLKGKMYYSTEYTFWFLLGGSDSKNLLYRMITEAECRRFSPIELALGVACFHRSNGLSISDRLGISLDRYVLVREFLYRVFDNPDPAI